MSSVSLLDQASHINKAIADQGFLNVSRTKQIQLLCMMLSETFERISQSILKQSKSFFKNLKNDQNEDQTLLYLNQYVGDMVKEISNIMSTVSKEIKSIVVEPITHFVANLQDTNYKLASDSANNYSTIETNTKLMQEIQKTYKQTMNKLKLTKQKSVEAELQERLYREEVIESHERWKKVQNNYKNLIKQFDMSNESRCVFTKNTQIRLVRILNRIVRNEKIETTLREFEKMPYAGQGYIKVLLAKVENQCGHSNLLRDRVEKPVVAPQYFDQEYYNGISEHERNKMEVDEFVDFFLTKSTAKVENASQRVRMMIIEEQKWAEYFLTSLTAKSSFRQINLPRDRYNELLKIVKFLFASSAEGSNKSSSMLYHLLWISLKIHHNGQFLIKHIKNKDFWCNEAIWVHILNYLKKEAERKDPLGTAVRGIKKFYSKGLINKGLKKLGFNKYTVDEKQFKDEQEQLTFDCLRQLNVLIAKLEMDSEATLKLLVKLGKRAGVSKSNMEKLVRFQYMSRKNELDKTYLHYRTMKIRRQNSYLELTGEQRKMKAIGMSLSFLTLREACSLLTLNNKWNQYLRTPVYQRCLKFESYQKLEKIRSKVYFGYVPKGQSRQVFTRMMKQVGEEGAFSDVIILDVKRSLSSRPQLQPLLKSLLLIFSEFNSDIGYVQGLNYQGENILKLTQDPYEAYIIMTYILRNYFTGIFGEDFDGLKLRIYQFNRLLQKHIPDLFNHFIDQKIQGQHFLVSWAITLWGEFPGDIVWIMWDGFLTDGWKWWMKTCIWLLKQYRAEFLKYNFQEILKSFSDSSNNILFTCLFDYMNNLDMNPNKIKEEIQKIQVTNGMLREIEKEYKYSIKKFKQFVNSQF